MGGNFAEHCKNLEASIESLKKDLIDAVNGIPDKQKYLDKRKITQVIRMPKAKDNWSPEHHNVNYQKQQIIKIISRSSLETGLKAIKQIVNRGVFVERGRIVHFNKGFIKSLQKALGGGGEEHER